MPDPHVMHPAETHALALRAFSGLGCVRFGTNVLGGRSSWGARENGKIAVPGLGRVSVAHDERGAPWVPGDTSEALLLSLTDEDEFLGVAWAQVQAESPLVGVGVDLVSTADFAGERAVRRKRLLFTEGERALAPQLSSDDPRALAVLFGAKEAAFKATAAPLRTWHASHGHVPAYDVRHFEMAGLGAMRGSARDGGAQRALDAMGVTRIAVTWTWLGELALVVACATRGDARPWPRRTPRASCGD